MPIGTQHESGLDIGSRVLQISGLQTETARLLNWVRDTCRILGAIRTVITKAHGFPRAVE